MEINPLSVTSFAKIFPHSVGCLFILFKVSFAVQKLWSLIRSHLFLFVFFVNTLPFRSNLLIFVFTVITLRGGSEKMLLLFMSESVWPMFSSKSFIVSGLIFRSLIHFEFIFVHSVRKCSISFFYMWLSTFPNTAYWRGCLFSIVYSCFLCHRLVDCRCVGLILGFLSCSTDLYFHLCASTIWFWRL